MGQDLSRGGEQTPVTINHPRISQAKQVHSANSELMRLIITCTQQSYKSWKQVLGKHKDLTHEHLLLPKGHQFKSTAMCATNGFSQIEYPDYAHLLSEQVKIRQAKNISFSEAQLWYLLFCYLSVKNYLNENVKDYPRNLIGDVRPENVFINKQGEVKFVNFFTWPGEKINYAKTFEGIKTYLSPEDYQLLELGKTTNEENKTFSELFSIGFTIISLALLNDNSEVYDVISKTFDHQEARKRINLFKCLNNYSELLRAIVAGLCEFEPKRRIEFYAIWKWIFKYEKRILNKEAFTVEQVPQGINWYVSTLRSDIVKLNPDFKPINLQSLRASKLSRTLQPQQVSRSPNGYYSPRNLMSEPEKQYKVFFHYQSPSKYTQTTPKKQISKEQIKVEESRKSKEQIDFVINQSQVQKLEGTVKVSQAEFQQQQVQAVSFEIPERHRTTKIANTAELNSAKKGEYLQMVAELVPVQKTVTVKEKLVSLDIEEKEKKLKEQKEKEQAEKLKKEKEQKAQKQRKAKEEAQWLEKQKKLKEQAQKAEKQRKLKQQKEKLEKQKKAKQQAQRIKKQEKLKEQTERAEKQKKLQQEKEKAERQRKAKEQAQRLQKQRKVKEQAERLQKEKKLREEAERVQRQRKLKQQKQKAEHERKLKQEAERVQRQKKRKQAEDRQRILILQLQLQRQKKQESHKIELQKLIQVQLVQQVPVVLRSSPTKDPLSQSPPKYTYPTNINNQINSSVRRSPHRKDFLDDVMDTNKILNHEQKKNYYDKNPYLNAEDNK